MLNYQALNRCFEILGTENDPKKVLAVLEEALQDDQDKEKILQKLNSASAIVHFLIDNFQAHLSREETSEEIREKFAIEERNKKIETEYQSKLALQKKAWEIDYFSQKGLSSSPISRLSSEYIKYIKEKEDDFKKENSGSRIIAWQSPRKIIEAESLALRRTNLLQFLRGAEEEIFANIDGAGKSILHKMLSVPMSYSKDLLLLAIEKTSDVKEYRCPSPLSQKSSEDSYDAEMLQYYQPTQMSLLEFLIKQCGFDEGVQEIGEVAVALAKKDCPLEVFKADRAGRDSIDKVLLSGLFHQRAVLSGLTETLCKYFINERSDASLLFNLLREQIAQEGIVKIGRSRAASSSLSRDSGANAVEQSSKVLAMFKSVIEDAISSGAINRACDSISQESIPSFILRQDTQFRLAERTNSIANQLWTYLQSGQRIDKLNTELFKINSPHCGSFLHEVARSTNANLLKFCIKKISAASEEEQEKIYSAQNEKGRTPFHVACASGFDTGIDMLFSHELSNKIDNSSKTPLISTIEHQKVISCGKLLERGVDIESSLSCTRPLYVATKFNQETIARMLLENGANPNRESYWIGVSGVVAVDALKESINQQNSTIIKLLIEHGVKIKDEQGQYLPHYAAFRNDPRNADILVELDAAEVLFHAKQNQKFKPVVEKMMQDTKMPISAEKRKIMADECRHGNYFAAFNIYHTRVIKPSQQIHPIAAAAAAAQSVSREN